MIRRFACEVDPGDTVHIGRAWRPVVDVLVECGHVRLVFDAASIRLTTWTRVWCAA